VPLLTSFLFRQGILSLEDCWPTKNPWFRLVTTLIGMSVVDLHRWDRNKRSGGSAFDWMSSDDERPQFLQVRSMSNLIGRGLRKPEMRYYSQNNPRQPIQQRACLGGQPQVLTRITNASGETVRPSNGKNTGKGYVMACFICRQYQQRQTNTNWWCSACKMPLCNKQRRDLKCYQEHMDNCHDTVLGCYTRQHFILPREYRKYAVGAGKSNDNNITHNDSESDLSSSSSDSSESILAERPAPARRNTRSALKRTTVTAAAVVLESTKRQRSKRHR